MSVPDRDTVISNLNPTFSGSRPRLPDLAPEVLPVQLWRDNSVPLASVLHHPSCAGFIFAADNSIEAFCKPRFPLLNDHSSDILGIIGDKVLDWSGGYIDQDELQMQFLGIIAQEEAKALDIQHSSVDLRTVTLSDGKTPLFKHLPKFPDDESVPVAAILHRTIPFEYGDDPPSGPVDSSSSVDLETKFQSLSQYAHLVGQAIIFQVLHYNGRSLHKMPGSDIKRANLKIDKSDLSALCDSIFLPVRPVFKSSVDFAQLKWDVKFILDWVYQTFRAAHPLPVTTTEHPAETSASRRLHADDCSPDAFDPSSPNFYRLLIVTSSLVDPLDPSASFSVPQAVSNLLTPILRNRSSRVNVLQFNQQLSAATRRLQSSNSILYSEISHAPWNKAALSLLAQAAWVIDPCDDTLLDYQQILSIFSFGPTNDRTDLLHSNIFSTHMDDFLDQAKEHRSAVDTKPFVSHNIRSWSHLLCTIQTLNAFLLCISPYDPTDPNSTKPWFCLALESLVILLVSPATRRWAAKAIAHHPHIPYQICSSVGHLFSSLCLLASD